MQKELTNFSLNNLFQGRLNRINYFKGKMLSVAPFVILFLFFWVFQIIGTAFGNSIESNLIVSILFPVTGIVSFLFLIIITFSILIKRHHDLGHSWKYPLIINVALFFIYVFINQILSIMILLIYELFLLFSKGDGDSNKYGPVDKTSGLLHLICLKNKNSQAK